MSDLAGFYNAIAFAGQIYTKLVNNQIETLEFGEHQEVIRTSLKGVVFVDRCSDRVWPRISQEADEKASSAEATKMQHEAAEQPRNS